MYPLSAPLFNSLNILTIFDIFKLELLKFVFDCLRKINPVQFHSFFNYNNNNINTANVRAFKLNPPQVRTTTYGLKSIKYKGSTLWNTIPSSIRSEELIYKSLYIMKEIDLLYIVFLLFLHF